MDDIKEDTPLQNRRRRRNRGGARLGSKSELRGGHESVPQDDEAGRE